MGAASLNPIFSRLNGITPYHPLSAETYADWSLEAGDIVQLSRDGVAYSAPVHSSTLRWNGRQKISLLSEGNRERDPISAVSQAKYNAGRGGSGGRRSNQQLNWEMTSEDGKLKASIKASAEELTSQYEEADSGLSSRIKQNAKSASMSVGRVTYDSTKKETVTTLPDISDADATKFYYVSGTQKYYIVRNGKWQQVDVDTTTGGAYYIKAGDIAIAINDSLETEAKIDADKVYLGRIGDANFSDLQAFAGDAATKGGVFADYLYTRGLTAEQLNAKFGFIANLTLEGLTIDKNDSQNPGNIAVEGTVFSNRLALSDDSYGIYFDGSETTTGNYAPHSLTINGTEQAKFLGTADVSFSRATSLSGSWGSQTAATGKILTVEGTPSQTPSLEYSIGFSGSPDCKLYLAGNGTPTAKSTDLSSNDRKWIEAPLRVYYSEGEDDQAQEINVFEETRDLNASAVYNNGWGAAQLCFKSKIVASGDAAKDPGTSTIVPDAIWVQYPNSTVDGAAQIRRYYVTADQTKAYIRLASDSGTAVAEYTHNQYALGQESIAAPSVDFGTLTANAANIRNGTASISNGNSTTIQITADATKTYLYTPSVTHKCVELTHDNKVFGRIDIQSIYEDGQNDVTIQKGAWANGQISFTKSAGTASNQSVNLDAADPSWSGNTATVAIYDGDPGSSGVDTGFSVTVTAPTPSYDTPTITYDTLSGHIDATPGFTVTANGKSNTGYFTIDRSTYDVNGTTRHCINAYKEDTQTIVGRLDIQDYAVALYMAGVEAGGAAATLESVSTSGRTKAGDLTAGDTVGIRYINKNSQFAYRDVYWQVPSGGGGGGGSHSPHIDSGNTDIWTTDHALSGWIEANTLKQKYETAKADGDLVAFKVKCGDAVQVYYMNP